VLIYLLFPILAKTQGIKYYNENGEEVSSKNQCSYYEKIRIDLADTNIKHCISYYKNDILRTEYKLLKDRLFDSVKIYSKDSKILSTVYFENNNRNRNAIFYDKAGLKCIEDVYIDDVIIRTWFYDSLSNKLSIWDQNTLPVLNDGATYLEDYASSKLKAAMADKGLVYPGIVLILLNVTSEGYIDEILIVKGINGYVNKEVYSVLKNLPIMKPGLNQGKKVDTKMVLKLTI
jgi:hypothetical protein